MVSRHATTKYGDFVIPGHDGIANRRCGWLCAGVANGLSHISHALFNSTIQMVRNIPHLALIPLIIIWFGIGEPAKVTLVAIGVMFPIYINTLHGIDINRPEVN